MARVAFDEEAFLKVIFHDEPLIAVLRGQMFVEVAVEDLIRIVVTNADYLFAEMDFNDKVRAAKNMRLLNKRDDTALQAVARLRNQFAHRPDRERLTEDDDKKMLGALRDEYRIAYDELVTKLGREEGYAAGATLIAQNVGYAVRLSFVAICTVLAGSNSDATARLIRPHDEE
jgi:hypothetical protein